MFWALFVVGHDWCVGSDGWRDGWRDGFVHACGPLLTFLLPSSLLSTLFSFIVLHRKGWHENLYPASHVYP